MKPTLVGDHIKAAWAALTDEQKMAWNYWALGKPMTSAKGRYIGLYGYQAYFQRNSLLGSMDPALMLTTPPTNEAPPPRVRARAQVWKKKSQMFSTFTNGRGYAWIRILEPLPAAVNVIVRQTYSKKSPRSGRPARSRHVTYAAPGEGQDVNVYMPRGYYASTAGANKFSTIKGASSRRHKALPFARLIIINTENGKFTEGTVENPG